MARGWSWIAPLVLCSPAYAETPDECFHEGALIPTGTVPANLSSMLWTPRGYYDYRMGNARLVEESSGRAIDIELDPSRMPFLIRIREPLQEQSTYVMTASTACPLPWSRSFHTDITSPPPTSLGTLRLTIRDEDEGPVARLGVNYDTSALPWRQAMEYQSLVDGVPAASAERQLACDSAVHRFQMTARIPDGSFMGETDEVESELDCGGCTCVAVPQSSLTVAALFIASLLLRRRSCAHANGAGDRGESRAR